jgi:hypothetical protein
MTLWEYLKLLFGQRKYIVPVAVLNPGESLPRDFPKSGGLVFYRQR